MKNEEYLDVVDENDNIIGKETRSEIHSKGILHREAHVWFCTPKREIIFQKRSATADTYPNLLDATVGGHVELGDSYEKTAIKETFEETGIHIKSEDIIFMLKMKRNSFDKVTLKKNYAFKGEYIYIFEGKISELKIEDGKGVGFEAWSIKRLLSLDESDKKKFTFGSNQEVWDFFSKIDTFLLNKYN